MGPEAKLEKRFTTRIKQLEGIAFKFVSPGYSGVTDRLVLAPGGVVVFVEIKVIGGRMSALQLAFERLVVGKRGNHFVIWCEEDIERFIEKYFTIGANETTKTTEISDYNNWINE